MLIKEFRIVMPLSLEEYNHGMLYSVAKASLEETGGGEGVEVLVNEPFDNVPLFHGRYTRGQHTRKIHRVESKVNWLMRKLAPKDWLLAVEEAWNAYPYIKTVMTNDHIGPDNRITIETMHLADRGTTANALELPPELLEQREVIMIDIAGETVHPRDYKECTDPAKFISKKTKRGQLRNNWMKTCQPVMCAYKLVTIEFNRWPFFKSRIENYFQTEYKRTFQRFNRQIFCWIDEWHGMTLEQIRHYEEVIRNRLLVEMKSNVKRGVVGDEN